MNETYETIRINRDVMNYLRNHARAFEDKEPNDVLIRELGISGINNKLPFVEVERTKSGIVDVEKYIEKLCLLKLPDALPDALQQILQVIYLVRLGEDRDKAAKIVAQYRNITYSAVADKYARQLNITTDQFDDLLRGPENELREILVQKFSYYKNDIENFFNSISDGLKVN